MHEFTHLAVPAGTDPARGAVSIWHVKIAEAVAEAWAHACLDRIAARALPPHLAAGIKDVACAHQYPD
ncbi:hypothetical protein ABZX12_26270 [Kribbella sp. NPDC003505]|uniref:hypothetical protein n=1 Tax=Kribbella sp. NPDC003505 TaxID=3154448 RepID=UPI0033A4F6EC